jgi:hypothetical protein
MMRSARSTVLLLARVGAVAFALTACGYLVVTAQRRANPAAEAEPTPVVDAEFPVASPVNVEALDPAVESEELIVPFVFETTATPLTPEGTTVEAAPFLYGSKSLTLPPEALDASAQPDSSFLYSSKSGRVSVPHPLPAPPSPGKPASSPESQVASDGTPSPAEPVFLPSSKVKTLSPLQHDALVPGSTTTTRRVFLPSSKSLRIGETRPITPAPVPADPPKNP